MFLGFRKGFGYALLYMIAPIFTFFVAIILAQPVAKLLLNVTPFGDMIYTRVYDFLIGKSAYFTENNPGRDLLTTVLTSGNFEAVLNMGIPSFMAPIITALILAAVPQAPSEVMIGEYVAKGAAYAIYYIASAILIGIVLSVILAIIRNINARKKRRARKEGFAKKPTIVSRLIGMAFGAGVGFFSVCIIGYAFDLLFMNDPALNSFLNAIWLVNDPTVMTIAVIINSFKGNSLTGVKCGFIRLFDQQSHIGIHLLDGGREATGLLLGLFRRNPQDGKWYFQVMIEPIRGLQATESMADVKFIMDNYILPQNQGASEVKKG